MEREEEGGPWRPLFLFFLSLILYFIVFGFFDIFHYFSFCWSGFS